MTRWRNTIEIKDLFNSIETFTKENIVPVSEAIIKKLNKIKTMEITNNLTQEDKDSVDDSLASIIDCFEFIVDLSKMDESKWSEFDFKGNWKEMFNWYINDLYDLGDTFVFTKGAMIRQKFLWVQ